MTAVLQVVDLEFVLLALMRFLVVAEFGAVRYDCLDTCMGHGDCRVNTPLFSGFWRRIDRYGSSQLVTGSAGEPVVVYPAYLQSAKME